MKNGLLTTILLLINFNHLLADDPTPIDFKQLAKTVLKAKGMITEDLQNCGDKTKVDEFDSSEFQVKSRLETIAYLDKRKNMIFCNGDTLHFEGEINPSNINRVTQLLRFENVKWENLLIEALVKAGLTSVRGPFISLGDRELKLKSLKKIVSKKGTHKEKKCSGIKKLKISSEGGELVSALKLYSIVSKMKLDVEVEENGICMSACTHLPNFAKSFTVPKKALFMFHPPQISGIGAIKYLNLNVKNDPYEKMSDQRVRLFWSFDSKYPPSITNRIKGGTDFYINASDLHILGYPAINQ